MGIGLRQLFQRYTITVRMILSSLVLLLASGIASAQTVAASSSSQADNGDTASPAHSISAPDVALGEPFEWSAPKYPKDARRKGVQGDIALVLSIDVEGNVSNVFVVSGNPELAEAAVGTARKWKYVPYDVNGKAVGVTTKVLVRFTNSQTSPKDVSVAFEMPTISSPGPVFSVGVDGVTAPKLISSVTPQYSEQARRDRYQGFCTLAVVIGPDGKPSDIRVTRPLGEGLDPKAIEAVRQWRFVPGRKDGKPVAVRIKVEVSFHLD